MKDLKAREIMSTAVYDVPPQLKLVDLENALSAHRISGAPVVEHGKVVGIVSASDIERALSQERSRSAAIATYYYETDHPGDAASARPLDPTGTALQSMRTMMVREIMTEEVISVSGDDSVMRVAELMRDKRIHRVLVIEDGSLLGIITSLDIVTAVADRG